MASHITFVYHHRGWLEKDADGVVRYNEGLVSVIDRVHVDTCNLFLVEGLFLDLGYTRYNEVYWLESGMYLANGLRVLKRDADVVKLCDAALKNKNRVHLYFEHPVDADPELVDIVEGPPSEDQKNHDQDLPQNDEHGGPDDIVVDGAISEIQETHQDDPTQYEEQQQQEGESVLSNGGNDQSEKGDVGTDNVPIETEAATVENEAPNLGSNQVTQVEPEEGQSQRQEAEGRGRKHRKKHGRLQPSGRAQPDAEDNGDELPGRRHHPRPPPSGQKILPPREENQAPRVVVPNQNDPDGGPTEYQYQYEELQTPPSSDSEDENPVFPQHNPDTKFGKIRLELGMEFGTMQQFKDAVRKYSIQMGREAFFLKVEPHRCRVICYNKTCPWEVYCARRNQPPNYQIKTLVDEHTCPRSNRKKKEGNYWEAQWVGDDDHNVFEVGHNSRTCPDKKSHVASEEDATAQQAPQAGQADGGHVQPPTQQNLPHMDLEDMSDSEQERFWEETMDAVEQELTQGHPHSEADEEANLNISGSTSQSAERRAPRTNPERRATRSSKGPASTPKTPSNTAAAAAASSSREGIRVKMPIMRPHQLHVQQPLQGPQL
ncbi:hypothetical protein Ahy_B10g100647 [Arachis hypogaea]|uniref:Uncharacterized protein n=1 Tax=Arachis hypogaea TaxID=3818 RepID=A0A444WX91_ARAHY|nr:hypothetical protein Ahy_B10g100647 [Arachis hypogaea]